MAHYSVGYPIIHMDTIHITSNDHSFGCPIIYMDTIHITSNDYSLGCPIIYTDTIHITRNNCCPIVYTDTIHITSNDCLFSCPITYMDTFHNATFYTEFSTMFDAEKLISNSEATDHSELKVLVPQWGLEPWSLAFGVSAITTRPLRTPSQ